ncbi:MAG: hypothetical protein KDB57_12575 [Solirubrobacterales bacterium]|nr:hypothetical protein [Solirubrobacterales bacterium]
MADSQTVEVEAGVTVQGVDRYGGFQSATPPPNDDFARSAPFRLVESGLWSAEGQLQGAGFEPGEPGSSGEEGGSAWWSWQAPASGIYTVERIGSDPGLEIGLFKGNRIDGLQSVPYSEFRVWETLGTPMIEFEARAGEKFRISTSATGKSPQLTGNVNLRLIRGQIGGDTLLGGQPVEEPLTGDTLNGEQEIYATSGIEFSALFLYSSMISPLSTADCFVDDEPVACEDRGGHRYSPPTSLVGTHHFEVRLTTGTGYRDPTPAGFWFHNGPSSPACSNGIDDDGDQTADFPADPGCGRDTDLVEADPGPQPADSDQDGISDAEDDCPFEPGLPSRSGCPAGGPTGPTGPGSRPNLTLRVITKKVRLQARGFAKVVVSVRNTGKANASKVKVCGRGPVWVRPKRFCRALNLLEHKTAWRILIPVTRRFSAKTGTIGKYRIELENPKPRKRAVVRLIAG